MLCVWPVTEDPADGSDSHRAPIANTQLYVWTSSSSRWRLRRASVSVGQVSRGYLNRPELTRERFIANPFSAIAGSLVRATSRYRPDGISNTRGLSTIRSKCGAIASSSAKWTLRWRLRLELRHAP